MGLLLVYGAYLLFINLWTAYQYAYDKRAAIRKRWRVPERTLLLLNLAGGVVGAWLAFFLLRHKTRKSRFWVVQSACSALHVVLAVLVVGAAYR